MFRMLHNNQMTAGDMVNNAYVNNRNETVSFAVKRLLDVAGAVILLTLLAPVMLVIALLIRLDSSGPIFFIQERVGARPYFRNGQIRWEVRNFHFFKFRSMFHNADESLHQKYIQAFVSGSIDDNEAAQGIFKMQRDPRVTRVGAFIRKTSLDELPQIFNVLIGTMSLVGPRPVPTYEVAEYQDHHFERLEALPGITGLWQVKGRGKVTFEEMIRLDIDYVRQRNVWMDVKILLLTIPAVLSGRGAG
jgi:lipopolysaccharide/colanic/teichoic acid biosynthesis glycosyltransferase